MTPADKDVQFSDAVAPDALAPGNARLSAPLPDADVQRVRAAVISVLGKDAADRALGRNGATGHAGVLVVGSGELASGQVRQGGEMPSLLVADQLMPAGASTILSLVAAQDSVSSYVQMLRDDPGAEHEAGTLVFRKADEPKWRALEFDKSLRSWSSRSFDTHGLAAPRLFPSLEAAVASCTASGYSVRDDSALERMSATAAFQRQVLQERLEGQVSSGAVSQRQAAAILDSFDRSSLALSVAAASSAQAYYHPAADTIVLVADRIAPGDEAAVYLHEVVHRSGRAAIGQAGWDRLVGRVKGWESRQEGEVEREIYRRAYARATAAVGQGHRHYDEELFAYSVEEAVRLGVKPSLTAHEDSAEAWLADVVATLEGVIYQSTQSVQSLNAQQLVNLAYALAQLESPERARQVREALAKSRAQRDAAMEDAAPAPAEWRVYEGLEKAVEALPVAVADSGAWSEKLSALVTEGAISEDDLFWSGLQDWLDLRAGVVAKDELLGFLRGNTVQVQEAPVEDGASQTEFAPGFGDGKSDNRISDDNRDPLGYYSALARGIEGMQTKTAMADGWKAQIKGLLNKGAIKAEELEWTGLEDWLDLQEGKVAKDQVLEYLHANGVKVQEVVLGRAYNQDGSEKWDYQGESKYGQYTLPDGESYREILLTLPVKEKQNILEARKTEYGYWEAWNRTTNESEYEGDEQEVRNYVDETSRNLAAPIKTADYRSSHWDQPNVLAHIRVNDRVDADGKRVLFVEEVQSDWGQDGKKKGFVQEVDRAGIELRTQEITARLREIAKSGVDENPELQREWNLLSEKKRDLTNTLIKAGHGVPLAPFVTKTEGWLNLALKRVITLAVEGGYDKVAFVTGEQSSQRYDLSKHLDAVEYRRRADGGGTLTADDKTGRTVMNQRIEHDAQLDDYIGKEAAKKLLEREPVPNYQSDEMSYVLNDADLKVGGEGMKAFYDTIVPSAVKVLLKKLGGGTVEQVYLGEANAEPQMIGVDDEGGAIYDDGVQVGGIPQAGFTITPAMREKVSGGQPLFSRQSTVRDFQEESPQFKRWFEGSKVVDAGGKPLVMYHGTDAEFDVFQPSPDGVYGPGSYLTKYDGDASTYGHNVMPVYVSLQNPYLATTGDARRARQDGGTKAWSKAIQDQGYDGIMLEDQSVVVAFRPEQIKSATRNNGDFDPANSDIRFSRVRPADVGPLGYYSALARGIDGLASSAAPAAGWKDAIKGLVNKGVVKQDEVKWSGVMEWLDLQAGRVTKRQLLEHIRGNGVQLNEVVLQEGDWAVYDGDSNQYFATRSEAVAYAEEMGINVTEDTVFRGTSRSDGYGAKYAEYTLPGGENYREVLLTLPYRTSATPERAAYERWAQDNGFGAYPNAAHTEESYYRATGLQAPAPRTLTDMKGDLDKNYKSNHWRQPNVLVHMRVNDRIDADGRRVLFVEELQSDYGQEIKKKGVAGTMEAALKVNEMTHAEFVAMPAEDQQFAIEETKRLGLPPLAPFVTKTEGWVNLALKRVIMMAVDGGYDKVAFVTGKQSADRYDMSKQVDRIEYADNGNGRWHIGAWGSSGSAINKVVSTKELPDVVGKELAQKIVDGFDSGVAPKQSGHKVISGFDLRMGGEGMVAFYDQIVPNAVKSLLKRLGGQMECVALDAESFNTDQAAADDALLDELGVKVEGMRPATQPGFSITPAMREKLVGQGVPLFSHAARKEVQGEDVASLEPCNEFCAGAEEEGEVVEWPRERCG